LFELVDDECGVCGGGGIPESECDCDGNVNLGCGCGLAGPSGCDETCGSELVDDECDVCGGGGIADGACDCDGNIDLGCGCGLAGPSGCDETCGSTAVLDDCGVCGGQSDCYTYLPDGNYSYSAPWSSNGYDENENLLDTWIYFQGDHYEMWVHTNNETVSAGGSDYHINPITSEFCFDDRASADTRFLGGGSREDYCLGITLVDGVLTFDSSSEILTPAVVGCLDASDLCIYTSIITT
jgi:hypothetical protein